MRSLAILLLLASCAAPENADAARLSPEAIDPAPVHWAGARIVYPPQLAEVAGGLPIVVPPNTRPLVGRQFIASWTTRPSGPLPDHQVALLASRVHVEPAELPGTNGGMLMVRPDLVLTPDPDKAFLNGLLTQEDGVVALNITFAPWQIGQTWELQLLVQDPRTPLRVTMSPMLRLVVGDR